MTQREKLIELLADHCEWQKKKCIGCKRNLQLGAKCREERFGAIADHLLANGVILLPCKEGDVLYITEPRYYNYTKHDGVQRGVCKCFEQDERFGWYAKVALDEGEPHTLYYYNFSKFGKTVFLTYEEAEAALKECKNNDKD